MITIDLQSPRLTAEELRNNQLNLHEIAKRVYKSKKTTVLTGAGILCNAGIPDFRSLEGLYNLVKAKFPNTKLVVKGQDLFDISLFRDETLLQLFCTFMALLYALSRDAKPTETHKFIKVLKERSKLLRCYTQNIDCLEQQINLNMGINLEDFDAARTFNQSWRLLDVVQLHGNLHKLACTLCFEAYDWTEEYHQLLAGGVNPECAKCHAKYIERLYAGKRITGGTIGRLRPNIVLYGENHPQAEILAQGLNTDLKLRPDMLIIMGTSLKVDGVKKLVRLVALAVHLKGGKVIFVNKTPLSKLIWQDHIDYEVLCDCDHFIKILKVEIPDLFLTQEQLDSKRLKMNQEKEARAQIKREKQAKKEADAAAAAAAALAATTAPVPLLAPHPQIKTEPTDSFIIKTEVNDSFDGAEFFTPPTTPSKKRPAPKLIRRQASPSKRARSLVPTPEPSFTAEGTPALLLSNSPVSL